MRDYQLTSPSLEGVLRHDSLIYEGIRRPEQLLRIMDGPASKGPRDGGSQATYTDADQKILEQYFTDIYTVFMKKLSNFVLESEARDDDTLKLQALLQELIKIKHLIRTRSTIEH
ncbi:MAG: hypothetical protein AAB365_00430 [Patescibacteria group bacterium]